MTVPVSQLLRCHWLGCGHKEPCFLTQRYHSITVLFGFKGTSAYFQPSLLLRAGLQWDQIQLLRVVSKRKEKISREGHSTVSTGSLSQSLLVLFISKQYMHYGKREASQLLVISLPIWYILWMRPSRAGQQEDTKIRLFKCFSANQNYAPNSLSVQISRKDAWKDVFAANYKADLKFQPTHWRADLP